MTEDRQLIDTIRTEWTPGSPHPGAFEARLEQRLSTSRRRRVVLLTLVVGAALLGMALLLAPEAAVQPIASAGDEAPVEAPAQAVDVWWDGALSVSEAGLDEALPAEYAALSSLFLEPLSVEGT